MRYAKGHKERTRERILAAAGRVFRRLGYAGGGVNAVMDEAGLSKGGFYGHFDSKDDLFADTIEHALQTSSAHLRQLIGERAGTDWVQELLRLYLSPQHRAAVEEGCPLPALLGEVARGGHAAGERLATYAEQWIQHLASELSRPGAGDSVDQAADAEPRPQSESVSNRDFALSALATIVGGMSLSRALPDGDFADEVLNSCRKTLNAQLDRIPREDCAVTAASSEAASSESETA